MNDLEKRIYDLEVKFSYQDELLNELNIIIADQQVAIDRLKKTIKELSEQSQGGVHNSSLADDKPPHY